MGIQIFKVKKRFAFHVLRWGLLLMPGESQAILCMLGFFPLKKGPSVKTVDDEPLFYVKIFSPFSLRFVG